VALETDAVRGDPALLAAAQIRALSAVWAVSRSPQIHDRSGPGSRAEHPAGTARCLSPGLLQGLVFQRLW